MQYVPPVLRSDDFIVEHLTDVPDHLRLLETFSSHGKAFGLEIYLKELAVRDEKAHESRHHFEERVVFAGCGVMAVGTNESNTYRRTQRKNMVF